MSELLKYTISILTYSAVESARKCIASVIANSRDYRLILTANGNQDAAKLFREVAATVANVTVIENATNEGFIDPNLKAFAMCDTEFFVVLNDDAVVPPDWLEHLRKPFDEDPMMAVTGPEGGCCAFNAQIQGIPHNERVEYVEHACAMMRSDILRTHGYYNPELTFAYFEDCELSLRLRELGYKLKLCPFRIKHQRATTSKTLPQIRRYQYLNGQVFRQRFTHYLRPNVRKFDYVTIVKRAAAWGDVLLTTPIIRALKQRSPLSPIWVETPCEDIFRGNPYVDRMGRTFNAPPDALIIDLNGAYESRPMTHIVSAYAQQAGIDDYSCRTEMFPDELDQQFAFDCFGDDDTWVALHVGPTTWTGKNWPMNRWIEIAQSIDRKVVLVGHKTAVAIPCAMDLRGRTTVRQLAAMLGKCALLVTVDSFPLHVAQAMGTPVIGLFGVTTPELIFTDGSPCFGVTSSPANPSTGIRHRVSGQTMVADPHQCMTTIPVAFVRDAIERFLAVPA